MLPVPVARCFRCPLSEKAGFGSLSKLKLTPGRACGLAFLQFACDDVLVLDVAMPLPLPPARADVGVVRGCAAACGGGACLRLLALYAALTNEAERVADALQEPNRGRLPGARSCSRSPRGSEERLRRLVKGTRESLAVSPTDAGPTDVHFWKMTSTVFDGRVCINVAGGVCVRAFRIHRSNRVTVRECVNAMQFTLACMHPKCASGSIRVDLSR